MAPFHYRAVGAAGASHRGQVDAADLDHAIDLVRSLGLTPVHVEARSGARPAEIPLFRRRVKARDLILFTRQLETMLESGLPLLSALEILGEQATHPGLELAIDRVRADVEQGSTLTEAMRRQPHCFPEVFVNLIHAGEEGGLMAQMLDRIGSLYEYEEETERRMRAATFYPILIVCELAVAFLVLVKFVLPRFASLFRNLNAELPLPTRVLIGASDAFERWWIPLVLAAGAAAAGAVLWARTPEGRRKLDGYLLAAPIFGPILQKVALSRFARVLSALTEGGIPIVRALEISRGVVGNRVLEAEVDRMREGVLAGRGLTEPLRSSRVVPPLVVKMLGVGEETGSIDRMLARVARYYDQDVDYAVKSLSTTIEPALLIVLGGAVLFTALAVFLPLWDLMSAFRH
jgi:type II secretory pathway component PulF